MTKWLLFSLITISIISCDQVTEHGPLAETLLMDAAYLVETKAKIKKGAHDLQPAYLQLLKEADAALTQGPYSVTDKEKLPPSGDKHDYASYSRYWWPDPEKPDGLPYIRKDGDTNPASQSLDESDRQRIGAMGNNAQTLGLAYYFSGEEKYAVKAEWLEGNHT